MVIVTLKHMRPGVLTMEIEDKEEHAFSTMENAERWLNENNFFQGRRAFFDYKDNDYEWCHPDEMSWDYINVSIRELLVDSNEESQYKAFHFKPAPWHEAARRDGFIEALENKGYSPEQIKEVYEKHFGEKFGYKLE